MPVLCSKLHYLNRKLQMVSVEVCSEQLWRHRGKDPHVALGIIARCKMLELEELLRELRKACEHDQAFS